MCYHEETQTCTEHNNCGCSCDCHDTLFGMTVAHVAPCCFELDDPERVWLGDS